MSGETKRGREKDAECEEDGQHERWDPGARLGAMVCVVHDEGEGNERRLEMSGDER